MITKCLIFTKKEAAPWYKKQPQTNSMTLFKSYNAIQMWVLAARWPLLPPSFREGEVP